MLFLCCCLQLRVYILSSLSLTMVLREVPAENIARPLGRNEVIGLLFRLTIFGAVTYFTIKWMVDAIDPTRKQKVEAQKQVRRVGGVSGRAVQVTSELCDSVTVFPTRPQTF